MFACISKERIRKIRANGERNNLLALNATNMEGMIRYMHKFDGTWFLRMFAKHHHIELGFLNNNTICVGLVA